MSYAHISLFMKKILILAASIFIGLVCHAQEDPCCHIVGLNPANNVVVAKNDLNGRLFAFKVDAAELKNLNLKDPVDALGDYSLITSVNRVARKILPEKINIIRINPVQPVNTSNGVGLVEFDYDKPCCTIIGIEKGDMNSIITSIDR